MDLRDHYLALWNAEDRSARQKLLIDHWSDDAVYVDPMAAARGRDELDALVAAVHDQFPGFVFTPSGPADAHHDVARFGWGLGPAGSEPVVLGFDVVRTDTGGRITSVTGFLDRVPA